MLKMYEDSVSEMKIKKTVEGDLTWGATPTPDLDNLAA